MDTEPKQLKLIKGELVDKEGNVSGKRERKAKEVKTNKWFIFFILVFTVVVSLVFYLSNGKQMATEPTSVEPVDESGLFGPKVFEF